MFVISRVSEIALPNSDQINEFTIFRAASYGDVEKDSFP